MNTKRTIIAVLLCIVMTAATAFAAAGFTDVPDSHWGRDYIQQAARAGIIEGESLADGTVRFRPEDMVSKQECITMLYRTLGRLGALSTAEDLSGEYAAELEKCGIAAWAGSFAAYGLHSGIIETGDFDEVSGGRSGGAVYESRQMIAMWTAKAMEYDLAPLVELVYKDSSSIDDKYLPYVDALYREGIMEGDKQMFNPIKGVKRVEIATVCTRLLDSTELWQDHSLERCLISFSGRCGGFDSKRRCFSIEDGGKSRQLHIPQSSTILINGEEADFDALTKLDGGSICACALLGGSDTVVIQTRPQVQTGIIKDIEDRGDYSLITIECGGIPVSYVLTDECEQLSSVKKNRNCTFIADGISLLEIE